MKYQTTSPSRTNHGLYLSFFWLVLNLHSVQEAGTCQAMYVCMYLLVGGSGASVAGYHILQHKWVDLAVLSSKVCCCSSRRYTPQCGNVLLLEENLCIRKIALQLRERPLDVSCRFHPLPSYFRLGRMIQFYPCGVSERPSLCFLNRSLILQEEKDADRIREDAYHQSFARLGVRSAELRPCWCRSVAAALSVAWVIKPHRIVKSTYSVAGTICLLGAVGNERGVWRVNLLRKG